jgi:hypothetical protein
MEIETYCLIDAGKQMARWSLLTTNDKGALVWTDFKYRAIPYAVGKVIGHVSGRGFIDAMGKVPEDIVKIEQAYAWRYLIDPWSNQGWLSPEGKLYGCAYYGHDDLAYALLRKTPGGMEWSGWVRVHEDSFRAGEGVDYRGVTRRQASTLEKLGFTETEPPGTRIRNFEVDRSLPAPRYAAKPPEGLVLPFDHEDVVEPGPTGAGDLQRLIAKLKGADALLAELLSIDHELVPEVGPGLWDWMIRWYDIDVGSEEPADELLRADGFRVARVVGELIEIASWHVPGVTWEPDAKSMIEHNVRKYGPRQAA